MRKQDLVPCPLCHQPLGQSGAFEIANLGNYVDQVVHKNCWLRYNLQLDNNCPICHLPINIENEKAEIYRLHPGFYCTIHSACKP